MSSKIVTCRCGQKLRMSKANIGQRVRCPKCNGRIRVEGKPKQRPSSEPIPEAEIISLEPIAPQRANQATAAPYPPVGPQSPAGPAFPMSAHPASSPVYRPPGHRPAKEPFFSPVMVAALGATITALACVAVVAVYILTSPRRPAVASSVNATPPPANRSTEPSAPTESVAALTLSQAPVSDDNEPTVTPENRTRPTMASPGTETMSLADLIELVEPAVVRLDTTLPDGKMFGSGVLVNDQGWIVTNFHVVEEARSVTITSSQGKVALAEGFYAADPKKDLVVLKMDPDAFEYQILPFADAIPRKGEKVAAFGSPMGFNFSATEGVISAVRTGGEIKRTLNELTGIDLYSLLGYSQTTDWIQMTAAISGGNSGGPLVDMQGNLIGINTWTTPEAQNLNFASTIDEVRQIIQVAENNQLVSIANLPKRQINARFVPVDNRRPNNDRSRGNRRPGMGDMRIEILSPDDLRPQDNRSNSRMRLPPGSFQPSTIPDRD